MKRILMSLMVVCTLCSLTMAQQKTTIPKDTIRKVKATSTPATPAPKGSAVTVSSADSDDSTYTAEFTDTPDDSTYVGSSESSDIDSSNHDFDFFNDLNVPKDAANVAITVVTITLLFVFGFPLFIIFLAFYFRYRSKKARYKLVEQALAAGQPIPEGVFKESLNLDTRSKGIKNICLGIGLFIFLWAITNSFGIGCIGLLVMFTGIGQWLVARNQHPTNEEK